MGWIVASAAPARQRLLEVTRAALTSLQRAVSETTRTHWPAATATGRPPEAHAEIGGDQINPRLKLWYGAADAPVLELGPSLLLSVLYG